MQANTAQARRILAVRLDNIGDVIMLSAALRELRAAHPQGHITLLTSPAGAQATEMLPWVNQVLIWRAVWQEIKPRFAYGPENEWELVNLLKAGEYDSAYIFTSFSQSPHPPAYACYLAGIPERIGQSKEFGGFLLTQWVRPEADASYQVDRNLHLLRESGIPVNDDRIELRIPDRVQDEALAILSNLGIASDEDFILAAPGASAAARRYDVHRFAEVCWRVAAETGLRVVAAGTEREREFMAPFVEAASTHPAVIPLIGQTTVAQLAETIRRSGLVMANNSASLHMAEAFNRPVAVFYSGTEYLTQWMPRYTPVKVFNRAVDCSPCYAFQCPYKMQCLEIDPREAATEIAVFFATCGQNSFITSTMREAR